MLKYVFLAGVMTMSAPALAQDTGTQGSTSPGQAQNGTTGTQETVISSETTTGTPDTTSTQSGGRTTSTSRTQTTTTPAQQTPGQPTTGQPTTGQPTTGQSTTQTQPAQTGQAGGQAASGTTPATTATQIAQVVDTGFPTYDKNADGNLTKEEFTSWMTTLRSSEPNFKAGTPETTEWMTRAFTQADTDKSSAVSKAELTTFLAPAAS
jgi:hypothetical protein